MDPTPVSQPKGTSTQPPFSACKWTNIQVNDVLGIKVDTKPRPQAKTARKHKAPYRKEKWKTYERVSVLHGPGLEFVSTTETPDNEKHARRLVRSEVMKNYHAKRRDALKESQQMNIEKCSVNCWRRDPFVKFPIELTETVKEFLDCGPFIFPLFGTILV